MTTDRCCEQAVPWALLTKQMLQQIRDAGGLHLSQFRNLNHYIGIISFGHLFLQQQTGNSFKYTAIRRIFSLVLEVYLSDSDHPFVSAASLSVSFFLRLASPISIQVALR